MEIKNFKCGICKKFSGTRRGLRSHLKEEHRIMKNLSNVPTPDSQKKGAGRQFKPTKSTKQNWWINE